MASQRGREIPSVIDQLFADPRRFDFFQAVRLLERSARRPDAALRQHVGRDGDPLREIVRFRAHQSLAFPVSEIERIGPPHRGHAAPPAAQQGSPEESPPEMFANFMGLTGPSGVLPRHYTRLVLQQMRDGADAVAEFFDLFNHRLISLFYRAWEKYRAAILVEQTRSSPSRTDLDLFTLALSCLVGMGTGGLRGRMSVDDDVFLYYSGCFSHRPATGLSLQRMLIEFLQTDVRLHPFHGRWLSMATEDQTRLPPPDRPPTIAAQLGMGAVAGSRVWDVQSMFRLRVGPIGYEAFRRLMPSGDRLLPLCQFIRTYVGPEWDYDVQLVLRREEVPRFRLDGSSRLGWDIWVRSGEFDRDVDDAVFRLAHV